MSDDPISIARRKRAEYMREIEKLDQFLAMAEELTGGQARTSKDESSLAVRTVETAKSYILSRGRPVPLNELYAVIIGQNIEVGGKDPKSTLSARLSNSSELVSIQGHGWWLKNYHLPPEFRGSPSPAGPVSPGVRITER